jgi:hypothetical protein
MTGKARIASRGLGLAMLLMACVLAAGSAQAAGVRGPAAPQAIGNQVEGTPGTIYYGATPAGGGGNKPVLVFVQGLHGQANTWWTGGNDMYSDAYYAGYRTAFVDLIDAGGGGGSIWANGQMLAGQLNTITAHYGVGSVNVVAHSKGGLDTNAAIVHYGAAPKVQTLFQLASPNWGSQLADLAYSWWGGWLAAILGNRDDAVYSLQTGQMASFRSLSDGRSENSLVHYRTAAGTGHGSIFGALWYGGAYLQFYGDNDGAVTLSSAHHPLGVHTFTDGSLDHDQMPVGHNTWGRVQPYVSTLWRGSSLPGAAEAGASDPYAALPAGAIIRGGPIAGRAVERFPVESGAKGLNLAVLTGAGATVVLRGPDGQIYRPAAVRVGTPDEPLGTATQHLFTIAGPAAGGWQAEVAAAPALALGGTAPTGAYMLVAEIAGDLDVALTRAAGPLTFAPGAAAGFTLVANAGGAALHNLSVEAHLAGAPAGTLRAGLSNGDSLSVALPVQPGVYNLSLTVRGLDARGTPFERSLTTSFAVGTQSTPGR